MSLPRLVRRHEVEERTGKSRAGIYESMDAGTFPRPVKIGPRAVAWVESEIDEWLRQRIADRDNDGQLETAKSDRQRQLPSNDQ